MTSTDRADPKSVRSVRKRSLRFSKQPSGSDGLMALLLGALLSVFAAAAVAKVEIVSKASPSDVGTGHSRATALNSNDGRFVLFESTAADIVANIVDANNAKDVYLHDSHTDTAILVSRSAENPQRSADAASRAVAISADGRWVLFHSRATNLVAGQIDSNDSNDVFLFDRMSDAVTLVSRLPGSNAETGNSDSTATAISADGSRVLFRSASTDLVMGLSDTNDAEDVFVYDLATGSTKTLSSALGANLTAANDRSTPIAISADGRRVLFESRASNLVAGVSDANQQGDLFLHDLVGSATTLISAAAGSSTTTANDWSSGGRMSADGQRVFFWSFATNLSPGVVDQNQSVDAYLFNLVESSRTLVSHVAGLPGQAANGSSIAADISADGLQLAFNSNASNLVPGTSQMFWRQAYLRAAAGGPATLVSSSSLVPGDVSNQEAIAIALSADGSKLLYSSEATDHLAGVVDTNNSRDVFLFDQTSGSRTLVSHVAAGSSRTGNAVSFPVAIDGPGNTILFHGESSDLVAGVVDPHATGDVFRFSRLDQSNALVSRAAGSALTTANRSSAAVATSADGRFILIRSRASDVIPAQIEFRDGDDVFLLDRRSGSTTLISHAVGAPDVAANSDSTARDMSSDGRWVVFDSSASDLVTGFNPEGVTNVYLFDRETGSSLLVSHKAGSTLHSANGWSGNSVISADGRFVLYESYATDLIPGQVDSNQSSDVFVFDRLSASTTLVSGASGSAVATADSLSTANTISADGNFVVFESRATNIVAGQVDTNGAQDVFGLDRESGAVLLVSHAQGAPTTSANSWSGATGMDASGRRVLFDTAATNIAAVSDTNQQADTYLFDRADQTMTLISHAAGAPLVASNSNSISSGVSADGSTVLFSSASTNLIAGLSDSGGWYDVFLRPSRGGPATLVSRSANNPNQAANSASIAASLSGDGQWVCYESFATNLVGAQQDSTMSFDVFLFNRSLGTNMLMSSAQESPNIAADAPSSAIDISADGRVLLFSSNARNLLSSLTDVNSGADVFVGLNPEWLLKDSFESE